MASDEPTDGEVIEQIQNTAGAGARFSPEAVAALSQAAGGNAALVAALEQGLAGMTGMSSGFIESLPPKVRRRIRYLEELQNKYDELDEEFEEEMRALEKKYRALYEPLFSERAEIVKGDKEAPPPKEGEEAEEKGSDEKQEEGNGEGVPAGVPEFWLNVLRNYEQIGEQISEKDEGVLEHLIDITEEELDPDEGESGFRLTFHFAKNPYFPHETLTKTYHMSEEEDNVLERAEGTKIEWASGKNPTVKVMKKKPKKGAKPGTKPLTKLEPVPSFFSFFSPPEVPAEGTELSEDAIEELQATMEEDYEMGETIREKLIPHAVAWYTGEAIEQEEFGDEDDDEDDEEDDEDDDDEDDDEEDDEPPALVAPTGRR
jgi:nucleosome assembly protein 1-like 1